MQVCRERCVGAAGVGTRKRGAGSGRIIVVFIPYETSGFGASVPKSGRLFAPRPALQWAALTVGVSAISASSGSRPQAELAWRSALMEATLVRGHRRWLKAPSYVRLDASEKSAVSFFLGMAQTQLTCDRILGIPTLVHLDVYMALIGKRTQKSRPDFLGFDPASGMAVAVEAKGRTHGYDTALIDRAKSQARKLPTLIGAITASDVASVAWFDQGDIWKARLEDPPRQRSRGELPAYSVVAAHYVPLLRAAGERSRADDGVERTQFEVPSADLTVSVPEVVFQALTQRDADIREPWTTQELDDAGYAIAELLVDSHESEGTEDPSIERGGGNYYRGRNLIGVRLGESWSDRRAGVALTG